METLEMPIAEEVAEDLQWDDALPRGWEGQELDVQAFQLWQMGNRLDIAADEESSDAAEAVGCHASCL